MKEVVYRRYKRLVNEKQPLPQCLLMAEKASKRWPMESHELNLQGKLTVVGLAKNERKFFSNR